MNVQPAFSNLYRSYQVRGHLAAKIDPLNINNKTRQQAKKLVIRSVKVQDSDLDTVFQLPETTWIGGTVSQIYTRHLFDHLTTVNI